MSSEIIKAAELTLLDDLLRPEGEKMKTEPKLVAQRVAKLAAPEMNISEERAEEIIAHYIGVLARNAEEDDFFPLPPLRYNTAMIEADALASACCGD